MSNEVFLSIKLDVKPSKVPISGLLTFQYIGTDSMIFWLIILLVVFVLLLLFLIDGMVVVFPELPALVASGVLVLDIFSKFYFTLLLSQVLFQNNVGGEICMPTRCVQIRIKLDNAPFFMDFTGRSYDDTPTKQDSFKIMIFIDMLLRQLK